MEYERLTVQLDAELLNKVRNIVYWEPSLTMKSFVEKAVEKQIEIYEEVHKGQPVQRPIQKLNPGRPIK